MTRRILIDPVTRLEGHGKITIILDDSGQVEHAYFQVPEFKAFELFCRGRAIEEMPALTQKICGVCPTAHHHASSKALDDLFGVKPPPAAAKIRELMHNAFMFEDHLLHFFFLGGPDIIVGFDAPASKQNILGVIETLGMEAGKEAIEIRKKVRRIISIIGGSPLYPANGLPGGVSKALSAPEIAEIRSTASHALLFAKATLNLFSRRILPESRFRDMLFDDAFRLETAYLGMVDSENRTNFYDGSLRVVDPKGKEFARFDVHEYPRHLEEHVVSWSYMKVLSLKKIPWNGFTEGPDSGIYRVGPLARFNVSEGMKTPLAQAEYERILETFGGKPVHQTLAYHWTRLMEVLYAAERMRELADDPGLSDSNVRILPDSLPGEGIGVCEAPRGTLIHHYQTDPKGIVNRLNLLVATQNNAAAICMSVEKAARALIRDGEVSPAILNLIEAAYRAYDPCLACATH
ncbi:MAG: Ni/Fe hydrogenase subunit alpha [Thermodesulfobacteriota bacterium]